VGKKPNQPGEFAGVKGSRRGVARGGKIKKKRRGGETDAIIEGSVPI